MTDKSRRIGSFFPAQLIREMRQQQRGSEHWMQAWQQLDDEMVARAMPAKYLDGELTLKVTSPVWANRIRLQSQDLLERLRHVDDFRDIRSIIVKVCPADREDNDYSVREKSVKYRHKKDRISAQSARLISEAADAIDDPDLKQALLRLSKREP